MDPEAVRITNGPKLLVTHQISTEMDGSYSESSSEKFNKVFKVQQGQGSTKMIL